VGPPHGVEHDLRLVEQARLVILDREVWRLTWLFAAPAVVGLAAGMLLFNRLDRARFRRVVFAVLFVSGLVLLIRG